MFIVYLLLKICKIDYNIYKFHQFLEEFLKTKCPNAPNLCTTQGQ